MNHFEEQQLLDDLYDEALSSVGGNTREAARYAQVALDEVGIGSLDARRAEFELVGLRDAIAKRRQKTHIVAADGLSIQKYQSVLAPTEGEARYVDIELFTADQLRALAEPYRKEGEAKLRRAQLLIKAADRMEADGLATAGEAFAAMGMAIVDIDEAGAA